MRWVREILTLFLIVAATPPTMIWWLNWMQDKDGPYERLFGMIVAADPSECGKASSAVIGILPGSCVAVEWTVSLYSGKHCTPATDMHVSRIITDANGDHELPKIARYFGPGKKAFSEKLRRPFILPEFSIPGEAATYHSDACFYCNSVDWALNRPVCKTTPDVYYRVDALP